MDVKLRYVDSLQAQAEEKPAPPNTSSSNSPDRTALETKNEGDQRMEAVQNDVKPSKSFGNWEDQKERSMEEPAVKSRQRTSAALRSPVVERIPRGFDSPGAAESNASGEANEYEMSPQTKAKRRLHAEGGAPRKARNWPRADEEPLPNAKGLTKMHSRVNSASSRHNKPRRKQTSVSQGHHRGAPSSTADQLDQTSFGTPSPSLSAKAVPLTDKSEISNRNSPRDQDLLLQPDSRPISQEQLASEVKSIYSALIMVENKCMHVDRTQAAAIQKAQAEGHVKLPNEHWQALTALHRTLLHEHHDFFLASQHPSASEQLRRLAAKYSMPARMWKHGIHSYLELLRHQLPDSLEYMLSFIYLAYQMMALLLETVPSFEDTWIECLGDLGRYRMAIEDEDPRDRETWAGVARFWYTKAANKSPVTGRLYHHLAILARPNALQQMYLYSRSLNCVIPFNSARDSVMTLLEPVLGRSFPAYPQLPTVDVCFLRLQSILLERKPLNMNTWANASREYCDQLTAHIDRLRGKFRDRGAYTAVTNIAAICGFGWDGSVLRSLFLCHGKRKEIAKHGEPKPVDQDIPGRPRPATLQELEAKLLELRTTPQPEEHTFVFNRAVELAISVFTITLESAENDGVFSYVYIMLTFFVALTRIEVVDSHEILPVYVVPLFDRVPWKKLCFFMNMLIAQSQYLDLRKILNTEFVQDRVDDDDVLPEDHIISGQIWSLSLFGEKWFDGITIDDERVIEPSSTTATRREKLVHAALHLAKTTPYITFRNGIFAVADGPPATIPMEIDPTPPNAIRTWSQHILTPTAGGISALRMDSAIVDDDAPRRFPASIPDRTPRLDIIPPVVADQGQQQPHSPSYQDSKYLGVRSFRRTSSSESFVVKDGLVEVGSDVFQMSYTIIVWDIQPLMDERDLFMQLVKQTDYQVVVPESVVLQLTWLATATAMKALHAVQEALTISPRTRIIGAGGRDVSSSWSSSADISKVAIKSDEDPKDVTVGIARQQSDLERKMEKLGLASASADATPAILVTSESDNDLNQRARSKGVHTAPATRIKSLIKASIVKVMRTRSLSRTRGEMIAPSVETH